MFWSKDLSAKNYNQVAHGPSYFVVAFKVSFSTLQVLLETC